MDDSLHSNDLLVRYLDDDLSNDEKSALENRLKTDAVLQDELNRLKVAVQAVRQFGTSQKVSLVHNDVMTEMKKKKQAVVVPFRKRITYVLTIAASILVIFISAKLFLGTGPSSEAIYNKTFVDFNVSVVRGNETSASEIEKLYGEKNYSAITTQTRSRTIGSKDSLLIGLAYLQTGKTQQAIHFFKALSLSGSNFQQDAEFYLSLSYLREKDYNRSISLMKNIAENPAHLYREQINADVIEEVEDLQKQ